MASVQNRINDSLKASQTFPTHGSYTSVTRSNGMETLTISNQKLSYYNLKVTSSLQSKHDEQNELSKINIPFQPDQLLFNGKEDLLCGYNSAQVMISTIPRDILMLKFSKFMELNIKLNKEESIIQCLFNNISLNCAELVILTTKSILVYDINRDLTQPVRRIPINENDEYEEADGNETTQGDHHTSFFGFTASDDSLIYDPVSISFGSVSAKPNETAVNPKGDLTLFLLTSDCSVYRLYPFLPENLQVSEQWIDQLFEYSTLLFNSIEGKYENINSPQKENLITLEQGKFASMLKLSTIINLKTNKEVIPLSDILPTNLLTPKVVGPLSINPFHDSIYDETCSKLLVLKNDVLVIVLTKSILVLYNDNHPPMSFKDIIVDDFGLNLDLTKNTTTYDFDATVVKNENFDEPDLSDSLASIQLILVPQNIIDSSVCPDTKYQSILLLDEELKVAHVDFSTWINQLSNLSITDMNEFIENLNNVDLPNLTTFVKPFKQTNTTENYKLSELFYNYNSSKVFISAPDASKSFQSFEIDLNKDNSILKTASSLVSQLSFEKQAEKGNEGELIQKSLLTSSNQELFALINSIKALSSNLNSKIMREGSHKDLTTELSHENIDISLLQTAKNAIEQTSGGLFDLFKIYGLINNRLNLQKQEFSNQLSSLLSLNEYFDGYEDSNSQKINKINSRQLELNERVFTILTKVASQIEHILENINTDKELSSEEKKLLEEFNKLKATLELKETHLTKILSNIKLLKDIKKEQLTEKLSQVSSASLNFKVNSKLLHSDLLLRQKQIQELTSKINELKMS